MSFHLLKHFLVYFHSVFLVELLVPNPLKVVLIVGNNKSAHICHFLWLCNQASAKHEIVFVFILVGSNNPVGAKHLRVDLGILAFCDKHQIIKTQSVENISYQADNQYTTVMLLNAVENALEKAEIDGTVEE